MWTKAETEAVVSIHDEVLAMGLCEHNEKYDKILEIGYSRGMFLRYKNSSKTNARLAVHRKYLDMCSKDVRSLLHQGEACPYK